MTRVLVWTGWLTWLAVGLPISVALINEPASRTGALPVIWCTAYVGFAPALAILSIRQQKSVQRALDILALAVATIAPLVMIGINPGCFAGALLVIVAWLVSLELDTVWAMTWVGIQSLVLSAVVVAHYPNSIGVSNSIIFGIFQFFAFCTAFLMRREIATQHQLLEANSHLKATRMLLANSSRIAERVRISRELHDVLGHDLTALSLHLEIARNTEDAKHDVSKAQSLAKGLLAKVRQAVSLMRSEDHLDIVPILRELAADEPRLKIHITADGASSVLDSDRAHTLLRCLQEAITNARVHSGAQNLWVDVRTQGDVLVAEARDDGCGMKDGGRFGNGLKGMSERLNSFAGSVSVDSSPGSGFKLLLTLPLKTA